MKLKIEEVPQLTETEITIRCEQRDAKIERLIKIIGTYYITIIGKKNNENYVLNLEDIFYFEAVDNHVFAYSEKDVFEVSYKLQELAEILKKTSFMQVTRTIIININVIKKVSTLVNGRILAHLSNNEKIIITRVYAQDFKRKLKE